MSASPYEYALSRRLIDPLRSAIGGTLQGVLYLVLEGDALGYNPADPNASGGCQAIRFRFTTSLMELGWGQARFVRADGAETSIMARRRWGRPPDPATGCCVDATDDLPWSNAVGTALVAGSVLGRGTCPEAVSLTFNRARICVAIGCTIGSATYLGDGDELLVTTEDAVAGWNVLWSWAATTPPRQASPQAVVTGRSGGPDLLLPEWYTQSEAQRVGYLDGVVARDATGRCFELFFTSPQAVRYELELTAGERTPCVAEPGLIIIPEVTVEAMSVAVCALWDGGWFEALAPATLDQPPPGAWPEGGQQPKLGRICSCRGRPEGPREDSEGRQGLVSQLEDRQD